MVVKHLKEDRNERTKKTPAGHTIYLRNTDFQTIAQVKERTHVDIAGDDSVCRDVRERLEAHPKIEWGGNDKDRLRYKPEFDEIRNMGQLRELIMKFEFGIARERLVDCYAAQKVAEDIAVSPRPPAPLPFFSPLATLRPATECSLTCWGGVSSYLGPREGRAYFGDQERRAASEGAAVPAQPDVSPGSQPAGR
jgi:hypothetical protein